MAATTTSSGVARDLVETVGARADSVASWLDQREPQDLLEEVKRFARRRPGVFLAIAAGAGVVIGRLTRSLATPSDSSDRTVTTTPRLTGTVDQPYATGLPDATGTYTGTGGTYDTGVGAGTAGSLGGAHVAEPETAWSAQQSGVTGTDPYVEPIPGDGTRRDDVTGAV